MNESRRAARFLLLLLLAAGCRGIDLPAPASEPAQVVPREPAAAPEPAQDPLETIARFEEARSDGGGLVELLLVRGEPQTRERAALALGRLPPGQGGSAVRDALAGALDDPEPSVRAAAAFGIGLRAEPASADALIAHARDRDARVRARVVEAASRVDDPRMVGLVLGALRDLDPAVRAEAALAPHRWTGDRAKSGGDAAAVDKALIDLFQPRVDSSVLEENVVLRAASFSLARRKSQAAAENHFPGVILDSSDPLVQIYGCQALAGVSAPLALPELRKALADRDWRVRCEAAIALGKHPAAESVEPLERALADRSAHVRRVACEALGGFGEHREAALAALAHAGQDSSANVRAAALIARARLDPGSAWPEIESACRSTDPLVRAGAAGALAHVRPESPGEVASAARPAAAEPAGGSAESLEELSLEAVAYLLGFTRDPNLRVAGIAVESLSAHSRPEARARLVELLADRDNGLRLAAVEGLRKKPLESDLAPLGASFASTRGEISSELSFTILATAAEIGGARALALLEKGLEHPDPYVRRKARELVAAKFPATALPPPRNGQARAEDRARPVWRSHPEVEIVTSRGVMRFELFSDETPRHVESFLTLAARDFYDGLSFHRVVPDFVIQGGDPRGDGNGGSAANGGSLAAEFTPRKFVRGSLGMPRNEDPDSGGAQIFVTHRETPHLDGRYTLFGLLRDGFDVLDAIEVGDTIVDVRIVKEGK